MSHEMCWECAVTPPPRRGGVLLWHVERRAMGGKKRDKEQGGREGDLSFF